MKRKAVCMLLMGAVALCLIGCKKEDKQASTKDKGGKTTSKAPSGQKSVQPVPGGQADTRGTAKTGETGGVGGAAGTAADTLAQQKNQYVQGAEQILNSMEQKLTAWQQQAGTQGDPAQQQKIQDLSKQVQTELADARAAVDKMRTATGTQLKDAKVAADQALQDAEAAFKNLQTQMNQTQVTQEQ